ncbi:MAG: RluA family pseudouridine synthase [Patescibacteria group bacterium]|jgi:23S rRNA pseudouridine1911/1915/1917 synthase
MSDNIITIGKESQGRRLDLFLVEELGRTRSQVQKLIKSGAIAVNGGQPTVHRFLKENDSIIITEPAKPADNPKGGKKLAVPVDSHRDGKLLWPKIKIIDDNDEYLIIEKPAGLLVHPTDQNETDTLMDWVIAKYPQIKKIGEDPARAGIVHRLDREVSGLMVIPKTQDAFDYFKKLFKTRQLTKKYLALVYGRVGQDAGEINFRIGRGKSGEGKFAAFPVAAEAGKVAKTLFTVKQRFNNYTLLELEILTGRTHQIRVHLFALGHPIVGDNLYRNNRLKEKLRPGRVFLHAYYLGFKNQQTEEKIYQSELPAELAQILKKLK